jgi:hypothetical protein
VTKRKGILDVEIDVKNYLMKAIVEAYKSINDIRTTFKVVTGTIYRLLEREGIK